MAEAEGGPLYRHHQPRYRRVAGQGDRRLSSGCRSRHRGGHSRVPRLAAARAAFLCWRGGPPLDRRKMLRAIADVLRKNGDELAMTDAADCGNPYAEMVRDAQAGAAQLDFYAGLVTEMKGASIPMGPDAVNFSVREPFGVVGRIIPF